jgi:hypothetical protein
MSPPSRALSSFGAKGLVSGALELTQEGIERLRIERFLRIDTGRY